MKKLIIAGLFSLLIFAGFIYKKHAANEPKSTQLVKNESFYWLLLKRKSNIEHLYYGVSGDVSQSQLIRTFNVKAGNARESPTPLPQLLGRKYWLISDKLDAKDNPETAPYFLTLDIPVSNKWPYGPIPYLECNGQCDWILPGYFGLHGVNRNLNKLSDEDQGSSGCVRHKDEDITFLYNILDPKKDEVRYYIENI